MDGKTVFGVHIAFRRRGIPRCWGGCASFVFGEDFLGLDEHAAFLAESTVVLFVCVGYLKEEALRAVGVINSVFHGGATTTEDDRESGVSVFVKREGAIVTDCSLTSFAGSLAVPFVFARFKQFSGSNPIWMKLAWLWILERLWTIRHGSTLLSNNCIHELGFNLVGWKSRRRKLGCLFYSTISMA